MQGHRVEHSYKSEPLKCHEVKQTGLTLSLTLQPEDTTGSGILYQPGPASWLSNPAFLILLPKFFSLSPETAQLQDTKTKEQGVLYQASAKRLLPLKLHTNTLGINTSVYNSLFFLN